MSPQALPDERPPSASARAAEGWERRFVADQHRAAEAIRLYRELGFEVVADPLEPDAAGSLCGGCRIHTAFQVLYTRRPAPNPDAGGATGVPGNRPTGNTMRDPIERLLEEHRTIMRQIDDLRRAVADLSGRGDVAVPDALRALSAVSRMMGTELVAHARREDEALFPALETIFATTDSPTSIMREEHRAIHGRVDLFRRTLRELNEVEHPAIVAGGETLRALAARGGSAGELGRIGAEIIELLDAHFRKEEEILFPMAREMLSPEGKREVARRMEQIDDE